MPHFNIFDRIYFSGERLHEQGERKISGPGALTLGLMVPLLVILAKLHEMHMIPFNGFFGFLYGLFVFGGTDLAVGLYYKRTGRHDYVMNHYRGRNNDLKGIHYTYVFGWMLVGFLLGMFMK